MTVPREGPGLVVVEDKLYIFGGKGSEGTMKILDLKTQKFDQKDLRLKYSNNEYEAVLVDTIY